MNRKIKNIGKNSVFFGILLLAGLVLFQAQTFYGKRRTGFFQTKEDGAPFGYFIPQTVQEGKSLPLVVIFGKKATDVMKWKDLAAQDNLVIVAIQPKVGGVWNYRWDIERALLKIKEVRNWYSIDPSRIWATGYEEGGNFALLMTINHPEIFVAATAVEAKAAGAWILADDANSGRKLDPFNYSDESKSHRPLWLLNFTQSKLVSAEDLQRTNEVLTKYGYPVAYEKIEGEPYSPTQKMIQQMYGWLKSQKV